MTDDHQKPPEAIRVVFYSWIRIPFADSYYTFFSPVKARAIFWSFGSKRAILNG